MNKPLDGIRILDLTHMLSGPYGSMILADLGAETIKVEPLHGEGTRKLLAKDPKNSLEGMGAYYITLNRNKKSTAIDLKSSEGLALFHELVKNVDVVDNGQKAVDREAEKRDYDIVYMDMQMPVMGGIDACKLIVKRRGDAVRPKVVFVTANVSEGFEAEADDAGGDGFISKPFSIGGIQKSFNLLG